MPKPSSHQLSRRERQIMDVVYQRGRATAAEVRENLADAPGYSAVRTFLTILVNKGLLKIEQDGPRYVYRPTRSSRQEGRSAIKRVLETFFSGSVEKAVAALLDGRNADLSAEEVERLKLLIEQSRSEGR